MNPDPADLRERMRSLTVAELRRTAGNHSGDHDPDEVRAAQEELTARFSAQRDGPLGEERGTGDDSMPIGLRIVFYLAWCAAVLAIFGLVFYISITIPGRVRFGPWVWLELIRRFAVPAGLAISIAAAIRAEHRYVRVLLPLLLGAAIAGKLTMAILTQQFTYGTWALLGVLVVAFCYFTFSGDIRRYYGAMSNGDGT
jgi:hypothetical protein